MSKKVKKVVKTVKGITKALDAVASDEKVRKMIFGEYSDKTPRSAVDSYYGEVLSPKQREKYAKDIEKKKKKGKKKGKKKKKKSKITI